MDNNGDCDDDSADAFPGQGGSFDVDGDGYGDSSQKLLSCMPPIGHVLDSSDCDDLDPSRHPTASWYEDADGDGFGGVMIRLTLVETSLGPLCQRL